MIYEDDDVILIGKLRRPGRIGANVTYDPGYGIRVEDEDVPPEPKAAASWIKNAGGWLRVYRGLPKDHRAVSDFLREVRRK